jgi:hypothetical protein
MAKVYWQRCEPDADGVVWNDLRDPDAKTYGAGWVLTYRDYHNSWHVMWTAHNKSDQLVSKNVSEEQLRNNLMLRYLFRRGETNNVR